MKDATALDFVVTPKGSGGAIIGGGLGSVKPDVSWALTGDDQGRAFYRSVAVAILIWGAAMTFHFNAAMIGATGLFWSLSLLLFALGVSTVGFV